MDGRGPEPPGNLSQPATSSKCGAGSQKKLLNKEMFLINLNVYFLLPTRIFKG